MFLSIFSEVCQASSDKDKRIRDYSLWKTQLIFGVRIKVVVIEAKIHEDIGV